MKMKISVALFILTLLVSHSANAQDTIGSAISQQKFSRLMKKKNTMVLDVRTSEEYKTGFIGKAVNYNVMDSVSFINTITNLDKNKKYLLYCKSGRRSGKALVMMKEIGFRNVRHLKGGVTEWKGELKKPS